MNHRYHNMVDIDYHIQTQNVTCIYKHTFSNSPGGGAYGASDATASTFFSK
jgi:hypothetical protein